MEWRDEGVVLSARGHGETSAIVEVFTAAHGRHAGVVRGGASRRMAAMLQPGCQVDVTWRARLDDHIGTFTAEPLRQRTALLEGRETLAALNATAALLRQCLPEREAHVPLYDRTIRLLDTVDAGGDWAALYLGWELSLLEDLGYGLDLSSCAATGSRDDLVYVSPRSGRAVSRDGAGDWAERLLPLPPCLLGQGPVSLADLLAGLTTTGHFLTRLVQDQGDRPLPEARARLIALLSRRPA